MKKDVIVCLAWLLFSTECSANLVLQLSPQLEIIHMHERLSALQFYTAMCKEENKFNFYHIITKVRGVFFTKDIMTCPSRQSTAENQ